MNSLRVALVGCGRMGASTTERTRSMLPPAWLPLSHAEAIAEHPGLQLVSVCDGDGDRAMAVGERLGIPPAACMTDAVKMLASVQPDILAVATRTPGRLEIIRAAVKHGVRGIHSEKPLAQHLAEGESLMAEIAETGIYFTYGTLRRFMAPYRVAKMMVDRGDIGEVREINIAHNYRELLMWSHPHSVDLLLFFGGREIETVNAVCDFGSATATEKLIDCDPKVEFAHVVFANGTRGLISSSTGMSVTISGTEGAIRVVSNGERVELHRKVSPESVYFSDVVPVPVQVERSGTSQAFLELYNAIVEGTPPTISPEEVALNQRVLWAIASSGLQQGKAVRLNDINSQMVITGRFGELYA
ncbi:Gfo/Idh/MocA family oxidoreductase [Mesorhizobium sp. WSM2239]|uniref:Gfo/Idh/MocA family oxidoreductase n=2 Tax=unclassified Mesorhizobium TaxID=325217 RepID=A0AAU8DG82_9HYPH